MNESKSSFYRPELDALRFFAFFAVFSHHAFVSSVVLGPSNLGWFRRIPSDVALGCQFGVDLFFILSAYLITELLLREKAHSNTVDVPGFYMRRILRIWPLYFVFVLFCWLLPAFSPAVFPSKAVIFFFLLSGNIYFTIYGGFASPVAPLWSISIEEQFYLTWPWVVRRASRRQLAVISSFLIVGAYCTRWILLIRSAPRHVILFNTLTRVDAIGIGVLIAICLRGRMPRLGRATRIGLFCMGIMLWCISASCFHILLDVTRPTDGIMGYACGTLGAFLFFLSFLGAPEDGFGYLASRPLAYLGRISYGLYVVHQLALEMAKLILFKTMGRESQILRYVLALALTIPLAAISYRFLESPFLRLKRRFEHVATLPFLEDSAALADRPLFIERVMEKQ